ncbi:uncharacterized protein ATC70_008344 [Mucor velutinosus]|uniref:Uncharacterized protein n=1 Tax=Mucor velutinosus TaxID=708070 RepID=A0AAN7DP38_9FUNG|nr:hypothetical protein ATC70_008344 [Mucor velutinosus]
MSPLITPPHIAAEAAAAAGYHGLGSIRNLSRPPLFIQEEEEEKEEEEEEEEEDNLSTCSVSTSHLSTLLPIEAITKNQAAHSRAKRMKRMVVENTMLSYATDYTIDDIVARTPIRIDVPNVHKQTENQRLTCIRLNLRYPSIVFNAIYHKGVLSTEQGVGRQQQQQNQALAFFNRNQFFTDQIEQSRRYSHYRVRNTSGSTSSQSNVPGIRRLSHQAPSSGGVSIRSNSDVHNTPEMHNLDLDEDMELERVQEENTSIWQQQHQFQTMDDDVMDYGGDNIDFDTDLNVGFSDDLLQQEQQQQAQEEEMHEFMGQLPNPFFFNEQFQLAHSSSLMVAKSFTNILGRLYFPFFFFCLCVFHMQ